MGALMNLFVPNIEYGIDAHYIANVFYLQNIATIKSITLVPYINHIGNYDYMWYQKAHITIHEWHDSEVAYKFIQRVKNANVEAQIVYDLIDEASWWSVEEDNTIFWINPELLRGSNTAYFNLYKNYHDNEEEEEWNELSCLIDRERQNLQGKNHLPIYKTSYMWDEEEY
jgi:hypothetical protein